MFRRWVSTFSVSVSGLGEGSVAQSEGARGRGRLGRRGVMKDAMVVGG